MPLYEYDLKLKMEDVEKTVILANAWAYPMTALIKHEQPTTNKLFTWPGRANPKTPPTAYYEGQTQTDKNHEQSDPMYGMCQEMREPWALGQQAEWEQTHTKENNPVVQKKLALARLYGQLEVVISSLQEQQDGASETPPKLRGAFAALSPYLAVGDVQQFQPFLTKLRCDAGHAFTGDTDDFDSDVVDAILAHMYKGSNEVADLVHLCGISLKKKMSDWLQYDQAASGAFNVSTRKKNEQFDIDNTVDVFKFEGGTVRNMLSNSLLRDLDTGEPTAATYWSGLLLNTDLWKIRQNAKLEHKDLPDLGGGRHGFYRFMKGLQCSMPRRNGYIMPATFGGDGDGGGG